MSLPFSLRVGVLSAEAAATRFGPLLAPRPEAWGRSGPLAERLLVAVAEAGGRALGAALGQVRPDVGEGLALGVAPEARRRGVGRALVGALESALVAQGCTAAQTTWRSDWAGAEAVAGLLAARGWEPPVVQKEIVKVALAGFEALPAGPRLPEAYTLTPWDTLSDADRADAEALLAADARARALSPWQRPDLARADLSLWVRHAGRVVGWMLVLVPSPRVAEYAALYLAPAHRAPRVALAAVLAAAGRHAEALRAEAAPPFGVFVAEPGAPLAVRTFARAWQRHGGAERTTVWIAGKRLTAA